MTDLLSEELVDQVEPVPEPVPEPVIESKPTKVDGRKKERTPAQLEAFQRAREAYLKKRGEINQVKKETKVKLAQLKVEDAKKQVKKLAEKTGIKIEEDEPKKEEEEDTDKEEKIAKPKKIKQKSTKPIVVVEKNSDSESEEDQPNVIFIKRKPRKKVEAPVEPPPIQRQQPINPFGQPYFMRPQYSR